MTSQKTFDSDIRKFYKQVSGRKDSISLVLDFIFETRFIYAYKKGPNFLRGLSGGFSSSNVREAIALIFKYLDNPRGFVEEYNEYSANNFAKFHEELLDALAVTLSRADDFLSDEQYTENLECLKKIIEKGQFRGPGVALVKLYKYHNEVDKLIEILRVKDWDVERQAVQALLQLGQGREDDKIVDALIEALQEDDDGWVRREVVEALLQLNQGREDDKVVDALIEALKEDEDSWLRGETLLALLQLNQGREDDKIVDTLIEALQENENSRVRQEVVKALLQLGQGREDDKIVDALIGALQEDEDYYTRRYTAKALGQLGVDRINRGIDARKIVEALHERIFVEERGDVGAEIQQALKAIHDAKPEAVAGLIPPTTKPKPPLSVLDLEDYERISERLGELLGKFSLVYKASDTQKYHNALTCSKRHFVILAGPSGTGKTRLAQIYAAAVLGSGSLDELNGHPRFSLVAVRPEWTDSRDLLGYFNPLTGKYQSTPALKLLLSANENQNEPHFLILDEMNIAHVEYYFSDFLSGMESGAEITLHDVDGLEIPKTIKIPPNLFVTGTINVDETTHEISPKVLDRAYVLVLGADWNLYYEESPLRDEPELGRVFSDLVGKEGAVRKAAEALEKAGLAFGYRTAEEIIRYVAKAEEMGIARTEALDQMFVSKILPKIRGSESEGLRSALETLERLAKDLPITSKYIANMRLDLEAKGFVKFTPI